MKNAENIEIPLRLHLAKCAVTSLTGLACLVTCMLFSLNPSAHAITVTNLATEDVHAQYTDPNLPNTGTIVENATRLECQWRTGNNLRRDPTIRFDVAGLPSGAVIQSITARLWVIRAIDGEYDCIAGSPSDWVDPSPGTNGTVITPGYVTYGATVGSFTNPVVNTFLEIPLDLSYVTDDGSYTLVIKKTTYNSASDSQFASTENTTAEWCPALIIDYIAGPASYQTRVETTNDGSGVIVPAQNLVAGNSITAYAVARDEVDGFVAATPASWYLTNITGNVVAGDLVLQPGSESAIFTGHGAGTAQIVAVGNATNAVPSGVITVEVGPPTVVRVEDQPDGSGNVVTADLTSGDSVTCYAIARDAGGNFIENVAATWSLENVFASIQSSDLVPSGDTKSAVFTANLAGTANIRATSGILTPVDSGLISVLRELRWSGAGTVWDTNVANSWVLASDNTTPKVFAQGDTVYLDDFGTANPSVSLSGDLAPKTILAQAFGVGFTLGGAGKITGPTIIDQIGAGTLTLLADNDYSGETIAGGPITVGNGGTTGSFGSGDVRVTATSLLTFNRSDSVTVSNRIFSAASANVPDVVIQSGTVTLTGTNRNTNARGTVKSGATLIMAKLNDRSLDTPNASTELTVEAGGMAILAGTGGDQLGSGSVVIDGTLDMQGSSETFGHLDGTGVIDSTVFGTNSISLTVGQNNLAGNFSGTIKDTGDGVTYKLNLVKTGGGQQTLGGSNSYHGDTTIAAGRILVNHANAIPSGAGFGDVSLNAATSALDVNGFSISINGLNGGNASSTITNSGLAAAVLTLGGLEATNTHTFPGAIVDDELYPLSVIKSGPATQVLGGANNYRGTTTVSAGKLSLSTAHSGTGAISVSSGTSLGITRTVAESSVHTSQLTCGAGATTNALDVGAFSSATSPLIYVTNLVLNGDVYLDVSGSSILGGITRLITYEGASGPGQFVLNSLPPGIEAQMVTNGNSIDLMVVPIVGTNLTITAGVGEVTVTWPESYLGWSLQVQTNGLSVGLSTNWVTVPGSDATNTVQLPVDVADPAVFYRMYYQTP